MQRRLVDDRAAEDRRAIALVAEGHSIEPGGPPGLEVPPEADLVASVLGAIASAGPRGSVIALLSCPGDRFVGGSDVRCCETQRGRGHGEWSSPRRGDRRGDFSTPARSGRCGRRPTLGYGRDRSAVPVRVDRARTGGRAPRRGGPRHDGCSRRAWRRCFRVAPDRAQGDHELARDLRAVEIRRQQPQHLKLTVAQRLDQVLLVGVRLVRGRRPSGARERRSAIPRFAAASSRAAIGWAFVEKDADVALRLGQRQGASERHERGQRHRHASGGRAPAAPGSR